MSITFMGLGVAELSVTIILNYIQSSKLKDTVLKERIYYYMWKYLENI